MSSAHQEDILQLRAALERAERERDSLRLERDGLEHVRLKDNTYLLERAERAEAERDLALLAEQAYKETVIKLEARVRCAEAERENLRANAIKNGEQCQVWMRRAKDAEARKDEDGWVRLTEEEREAVLSKLDHGGAIDGDLYWHDVASRAEVEALERAVRKLSIEQSSDE